MNIKRIPSVPDTHKRFVDQVRIEGESNLTKNFFFSLVYKINSLEFYSLILSFISIVIQLF